jgi:hypothetical protein
MAFCHGPTGTSCRTLTAVPKPTRRASEGTGRASATVLGQRPALARRVSVASGCIWPGFDALVSVPRTLVS